VEAKEVEDKSFADILKIGLGKQEVQAEKIVEAKKTAMEEGYEKGYAAAERLYKVTYNCSKCGQPTEVTSDEEKQDISEYMRANGWSHKECPQTSQGPTL